MTTNPLRDIQKEFKDSILQRLEHEIEYRKDIAEHSPDPITSHARLLQGLRLSIALIKRARFIVKELKGHD